jgi:hypothetical protein
MLSGGHGGIRLLAYPASNSLGYDSHPASYSSEGDAYQSMGKTYCPKCGSKNKYSEPRGERRVIFLTNQVEIDDNINI